MPMFFVDTVRPTLREQTETDITMEGKMRPVGDAERQTVFYRVPVYIIDMPVKVIIIPYCMLPESALP